MILIKKCWAIFMLIVFSVIVGRAEASVQINATNFPDENFREYVKKEDTNKDNYLSNEEINSVVYMYISDEKIKDLKGVEFFTNLSFLSLFYISSKGQLTSLDVSKNTALVTLRCSNAQLNVLDVSKNKALVTLDCSSNKLTKLDISKNTKLTSLSCSNNYLTKLDITKNTALTSLACTSNSLSTLNISKNKLLTKVSCSNNSLTKLDVTKNTSLTSLLCGNNKLTKIDLTQNIKLISLDCSYNELTKLNVTKNVDLISLKCQNNQLTKLDVSKNNDLTILRCDHNQFSTLDFTNNPALTSLHCEYNQLKKLNLSRNTFLTDLRCQNNQLTQLDVTNNKNLITLYCHNNHLKKLDLSKNTKLEFDSWSDYIQQQITGLKITQDKNYLFYVNLKNYLSNEISKIKSVEATNNYTAELVEYNATTGIAKFNYLPTGIYYEYDTGNAACMRVKLSPASEPVIATKYLPEALYEKSYRVSLKATGSTPISWTYSGKLPEGLSLSSEGRIIGHPTTSAVTSEFTVIASNDSGMASQKLKIVVPTKPKIVGKFKDGNIKNPYSSEIKLSNGTSPYNWILTGTLPKGLKLQKSGNKAILTGIPSKNGTYGFKLKVIDKYEFSDERAFSIVITKPTIGGSLASNGIVKKSYSSTLSINGGTSPYTWVKSGTLPTGLKLTTNSSGTKLYLKGTPTTAKAYTFTLKATDKNGATASKKFTVTITKPTISGTLTASGVIKKSYTGNLTVSKGTSPYTWSLSSGKLPDGVTLTQNSAGSKVTLKGKPTKTGKFTFTLKVVDKNKATASKKFTVTVTSSSTTSKSSKDGENNAEDYLDYLTLNITPQEFLTEQNGNEKSEQNPGYFITELKILSEDILLQGEGKDEDLFEVKAENPVRFIISEWINSDGSKAEVLPEEIYVCVDEKPVEEIIVYIEEDEMKFMLPSEFVHDDFKVQAKTDKLETMELFISAIK